VIPWLAPRYGGPAILVPQASVALTERGHSVEIITTNADGSGILDVPTGHVVDWAGAAVTFHPMSAPRWYITSWPLLADLRRRLSSFDIVHIHYLYRFHGLAAAAVARLRRIPFVIQAHGSLDPWHRNQKRRAKDVYHALVEDRIIGRASAILCSSELERSYIRNLGYASPQWVIPIGIDADELRTQGSPQFLRATGISAASPVVTFLGRISAKKGVPLLVDSFRHTAQSFPMAHLVVAGPDEEGIGRRLRTMIAGTELAPRISFVGPVAGPDKRALLQRSAVFVLPSEDESFGIAVAEAMAVGCPVVVSPQVAIKDVVDATGAGIVAERNSAAIAKSIGAILADPVRATAMGDAGKRAVDERFAWPIVAEQMESMYEAVIQTSGGRTRFRRSRP
jgi:glycosyltransferase involved in cell wall biosynthesis